MRHISRVVFSLTLVSVGFAGKPEPDWKSGRILDSQMVRTRTGTADTAEAIPTISDTQLMVLSLEFAYVIQDTRVSGNASAWWGVAERAISNRHHGCRFIVGDSVKYWQEKAILHILDADGKECKVDVLRQERLKASNP